MLTKIITTLKFVLLVYAGCASGHSGQRFNRGIRGTYTSTVIDTSVVTSLVPSSCVYVDATLPPCRSVRFLQFPYFTTVGQLINGDNKNEASNRSEPDPLVQSTPLGWGEYFGLYAPTVTVTETKIETTVVQDPRVVVTYALKGCKPLKIPDDLDRCPESSSAITIEEILPTSTVTVPPISPTSSLAIGQDGERNSRFIEIPPRGALPTLRSIEEASRQVHQLESSNEKDNLEPVKSTEALPF